MSMIEIDPHLFIKCRLCLEESGKYQIVPAIGEQISFCFGINVEPFDGLPQLICKKCQLVLSDYSETKHNFIKKQEDLMKRKPEKDLKTSGLDRSKNLRAYKRQHENNDEDKSYIKFKRRRLLSSSSEKSNDSNSHDITDHAAENTDWKANYQKTYKCTFCNFTSFTLKSIKSHQVIHKALKLQHFNVFNRYCSVIMPIIFDKPNLTGTTDHVIYSKNKIIAKNTTLTADYSVAYKYKDSVHNANFKRADPENADAYSDSSFKSNKKVGRMRIRSIDDQLTSRSSTETVLLENDANVCINIDDSDSSDVKDETKEKRKAPNKTKHIDVKEVINMLNKLITVSYNKFIKRHEILDKSTLQLLNRKIVSIGRQIINKRGFNTHRLIKYMEHLDLNIIWLARSPLSVTNSTNYFKIIPRTRYPNEKSINDFEGLTKKYEDETIQNRVTKAKLVEAESTEGRLGAVDSVETAMMAQMSNVDQDVNITLIKQDDAKAEFDPVLLNENPVANPKQLKKLLGEAKKNNIESNSMPTLEVNLGELSWDVMTNNENNMPVITLTRSLASPNTNENSNYDSTEKSNANNENTNPDPIKTAPRIKVKSVSELMSKETLSRMNEPAPVLSSNQLLNGGAQCAVGPPERTSPVSRAAPTSDDFVLLDSVELPNTKTNSPFNYLKMLMQVHNLHLLDTCAVLTSDFHSIIRFKVRYNQNQGMIVLNLSLLCSNNTICLKVKDRYNRCNIEMTKISANWQWEILKIYKGEVVSKLLENAEKTGPEVFNNVNRFICLLKSINNLTI